MINIQKNIIKHRLLKLVTICILLTLVSYVFLNVVNQNKVYAAVQVRENYSDKINNYPGYKELIDDLKTKHPNWNFTILYTGLDWNQVIKNETSAYHGRNVVPASRSSAWKCAICGNTPHGGSSWRCASEIAVAYYMDPRNWLNDSYIFEFESLSYNEKIQTVEGVQKIISGIKYMQGEKITYTKTDGTTGTLEKSYAQVIMDAAKEAGISPYHLASRLRQEQGAGTTPGSTATGTYGGYVGYYNFLNIKASGSTDREVIVNGLAHAKSKGWTDPQISIIEGAKVLAKNYINDGQDTLYLQKFDVDSSDGTLYYFQYMQNVSASVTEGVEVRKAYENLGLINSSIDFIIPVYENMPETKCTEPVDSSIVTQNVKIKGTNVNVRSAPTTNSDILAKVNTGDILLRIEKASTVNGDNYWDKVVLPDGTKGYVARAYLLEMEDVTNCNETVVANTSVNLRNGPGLNGTTIITMLTEGQALTRIETGKYNLDGYVWDRVKLADGRQGYIAQNYINKPGEEKPKDEEIAKTELVKVICNSGLKLRENPGTDQKILTYVYKDAVLTRTKANVSNVNGYVWDKVVTSTGIEGYIARGDSKEQYIQVITTNNTTSINNDNFKIEDKNLMCEPNTTIETIKQKNTGKTVTIKKADGTVVTSGTIGTGYTVTIDKNTYTVVKLGDVNGDGQVKATDYMTIKNHIMNNSNSLAESNKKAADVNKDGQVKATDYMTIKNHIMDVSKINI